MRRAEQRSLNRRSRIVRNASSVLAALLLAACSDSASEIPVYVHGEEVPAGSAAIARWTTALGPGGYDPGPEATSYSDYEEAFGPATSSSTDVVSLGRGGSITLDLGGTMADGPGAEIAVFENGLSGADGLVFAELGFVSVSSDGSTFTRFPTATRREQTVDAFESVDPTLYSGFAGLHPAGSGTAFDLAELADQPEVVDGSVSLSAIRYVRITDVIGDGSTTADDGNPIYDPYPTTGSAGFDLDGVAILR